jgi:hypothetical protein
MADKNVCPTIDKNVCPTKRVMGTPTTFILLALLAALGTGIPGTACAAGHYIHVDYPASTVEGELQIAVTRGPGIRKLVPCFESGEGGFEPAIIEIL